MSRLLALSALLFLSGAVSAADLPVLPFGPGEECTFQIGFGIIDAGEATLTVESELEYYGSRVFHLRTRARSNRFFTAFFRVRDQADSYLDVDGMVTRYFNKHLREGDFQRDVEIHFDHDDGKAYFPDGRENEIPQGTQDVLSAFFRVRAMELNDGDEIVLPTHGDKELYDLRVIVHGREVLDTALGKIRCVKVQPMMDDEGLFKHRGDLFVWLSDDARRIPVLLQANIPVGAIEGKLTKYRPPHPQSASDGAH